MPHLIHTCDFSFLFFEISLKDFPFYLPILLTLWFRYLLLTQIEETCMYSLKFPEKCNFLQSADLNFKHFPFSVYHGATPWSLKVKQMLKKLNLWGKRAVDKSAWIKTCPTSNPEVIRSLEIRLHQQYQLKF